MARYYDPQPPYWDLAQAIKFLGVDQRKFRAYIKRTDMPCCFESDAGYKSFYPEGLRRWARENTELIERMKECNEDSKKDVVAEDLPERDN